MVDLFALLGIVPDLGAQTRRDCAGAAIARRNR